MRPTASTPGSLTGGTFFVLALCAALGCSNGTVPTGAPDSATSPDLIAAPDLTTPDFATPDLALPDLALPDLALPDLARPDLATPDLTAPTCTDGARNGTETDVDCGGAACSPCGDGKACIVGSDCASAVCSGEGVCQAATCTDGAHNGDETDVDCGGPTCGACGDGRLCGARADCSSLVCTGGRCQAPTCSDGVKNGNESDVDCGGGTCTGCVDGSACSLGRDCAGASCSGGACVTCRTSNGLVGYWQFDEGSGTVAADSSGRADTGTLNNSPAWSGPAPTPYANTHALTFDGVRSYVTMGNQSSLQLTGALTLAAWFQTTTASIGNYRTLVGKWWSGGSRAAYDLNWTTGGGLGFSVNGASNASATASSNLALNDGSWHFVVGTWDGTTIRIYIDGKVKGETFHAGFGPLSDIADPFDVGTDDRYSPGTGDRFFQGSIDDVRIYDRALLPEEVGQLFIGSCARQ